MFWKTWVQLTESRSTGSRPWRRLSLRWRRNCREMLGPVCRRAFSGTHSRADRSGGGRGSSFRRHAEFAAIGGRGHPYGAEELFVDGPVCRPDVFPGRFCRVDLQALQGDGRIAPLQWLGIESPKAALKSMTPPQAADAAQQ